MQQSHPPTLILVHRNTRSIPPGLGRAAREPCQCSPAVLETLLSSPKRHCAAETGRMTCCECLTVRHAVSPGDRPSLSPRAQSALVRETRCAIIDAKTLAALATTKPPSPPTVIVPKRDRGSHHTCRYPLTRNIHTVFLPCLVL